MKYEPQVCFTKKQQKERKRWLKDYLENVWDISETTIAFDARLVEYLQLGGTETKLMTERRKRDVY